MPNLSMPRGIRLSERTGAFRAGLFLFPMLLLASVASGDDPFLERRIGDAVFVHTERFSETAEALARAYPALLAELYRSIGWEYDRVPDIVLADTRERFEAWAGTEYFSAFAVPDRELIVLDPGRMADFAALEATLKHELCHLLLHRHIDRERLPRWLDEGVAQWTSDGLSELLIRQDAISLPSLLSAGRLFDLSALAERFPHSRSGLALAYAQSRSVVDFIVRDFGREGLLDLLEALKAGREPEDAARAALGLSLTELEARWRESLGKTSAWLLFLAANLYEFTFVAGALATVFGFVRLRLRQRRYAEWEAENEEWEDEE